MAATKKKSGLSRMFTKSESFWFLTDEERDEHELPRVSSRQRRKSIERIDWTDEVQENAREFLFNGDAMSLLCLAQATGRTIEHIQTAAYGIQYGMPEPRPVAQTDIDEFRQLIEDYSETASINWERVRNWQVTKSIVDDARERIPGILALLASRQLVAENPRDCTIHHTAIEPENTVTPPQEVLFELRTVYEVQFCRFLLSNGDFTEWETVSE